MSKDQTLPFRVLLAVRIEECRQHTLACLQGLYGSQLLVTEVPILSDAIEHLESGKVKAIYDLIIFEHNTSSQSLVKVIMDLAPNTAFIMAASDQVSFDAFESLKPRLEMILQHGVDSQLPKTLKKLATVGKIPPLPIRDELEYFSVTGESLVTMTPLQTDVYVRFGHGRFVCLFKKGAKVEPTDLKKYQEKMVEADVFYIKRADSEESLHSHADKINEALAKAEITQEEAQDQFKKSYPLIKDVVNQLGFTPQAQAIAKSCVAMSLKALGTRPKLSRILTELKKKEGDYIIAHSYMVGQVACALANRLEWNSAATFFKLSLAAFMHDITLNNSELATMTSIHAAKTSGKFSAAEIQMLLLHTVKASEYSRQFNEIPSDVDQIIFQHHERPDGSGFPREMNGKFISPLSALFIMSHDLVHYFYDHPGVSFETFFETHSEQYQVGQFKKIIAALKSVEDPH